MKYNDFAEARSWIDAADAVVITASNGLSIAEGYNIFADNDDYKKYFAEFREKYGTDCLIRGVFAPMKDEDHEAYMHAVHRYLIDDYHGSTVMKNLLSIVRNKPYFIVTSNGDTHFQMNGFDESRIFEAEGNFDGLSEQSDAWDRQQERFSAFIQKYAAAETVLLELGIGSRNQLIKAPTMRLAAQCPSWKYITMNLPQEINVIPSLNERSIALTGDIGVNLEKLLSEGSQDTGRKSL